MKKETIQQDLINIISSNPETTLNIISSNINLPSHYLWYELLSLMDANKIKGYHDNKTGDHPIHFCLSDYNPIVNTKEFTIEKLPYEVTSRFMGQVE